MFGSLLSCYHIDDSLQATLSPSENYSSMRLAGVSYLLPPSSHFNLQDFMLFCENNLKSPYDYEKSYFTDTTGDGRKELVSSHISVIGNQIHLQNTIEDHEGNLLWNDKGVLTLEEGGFIFGEEGIFNEYYPVSGIYAGIQFSSFVDSLNHQSDYDRRKKELLRYLAGNPDIDELPSIYSSSLNQFLDSYQGKLLFTLDAYSPEVYAWSKDKKAFVPLRIS